MDEMSTIHAIDQRKLPFSFEIFKAKTIDDTCFAIKEMVVRGAPLIGVTAAYGILQDALNFKEENFKHFKERISNTKIKLSKTRPTAVDLFNVLDRVTKKLDPVKSVKENIAIIRNITMDIVQETIEECKEIGQFGNGLIPMGKSSIMTICNAGALATIDYGTALAPIRKAHEEGKMITVFVNETRPRIQGGRLTAWELYNEGIEHFIIVDSAAGHLIKNKKIDLVITGADRIALNGDTANKIGTYTLSVLCKENNIPFYVAAPKSTFDRKTKTGKEITIEERDEMEVQTALGINEKKDKEVKRIIIHNLNSKNLNPAFDITPSENISGIITPLGILKQPLAESIKQYLSKNNEYA
ncbi:MAG: S-methyl-5-thioribose-1-phosphate isomerase [Candidatus Heimdallarchaeota archaeon]|nr:S-methyl-5-thioribose-1-phosphate isomerase [Candidatus Heimdallarchaeota archaeon]